MRWNPFRAGAQPGPETAPGPPGKPPVDKLTMAIRQRRMFSAQQRVDQLPGFPKLERGWCEQPTADELDARLADLGEERRVQQWPDADALAAALRSAASLVPPAPGFAFVRDEPEARWVEARLPDLLVALAGALPGLRKGAVLFSEAGALLIDVEDGRGYATATQGEWPLPSA